MHPIQFEIGGFPVCTYGILLAVADLVALPFAGVRARRAGPDGRRVMDFYRGDERGSVFGLSISQVVSLMAAPLAGLMIVRLWAQSRSTPALGAA